MDFLKELGIESVNPGACSGEGQWSPVEGRDLLTSYNPTTGEEIASVAQASSEDYEKVMAVATETFKEWRMIPAPARGLVVRDLGEALRAKKEALGKLVAADHAAGGDVGDV